MGKFGEMMAKKLGAPSPSSTDNNEVIKNVFLNAMNVSEVGNYDVGYGYFMKEGILSKKMYNYVIGLSEIDKEFIVIRFDTSGNFESPAIMKYEDITSIKKTLQGNYKVNSTKGTYKIAIVPSTPKMLESAYGLSVSQEEFYSKFDSFVKSNF